MQLTNLFKERDLNMGIYINYERQYMPTRHNYKLIYPLYVYVNLLIDYFNLQVFYVNIQDNDIKMHLIFCNKQVEIFKHLEEISILGCLAFT